MTMSTIISSLGILVLTTTCFLGIFSKTVNSESVVAQDFVLPEFRRAAEQTANVATGISAALAEPDVQDNFMNVLRSSLSDIPTSVFQEETIHAARYNYNVSEKCLNSTEQMISDLISGNKNKSAYALQMLDAFGKLPSGVLKGNIHWNGAYEQCMEVEPKKLDFTGKYCTAAIGGLLDAAVNVLAPGQKVPIYLGTCFPSTCSGWDAVGLLNAALVITANRTTGIQKIHADYAVCVEPVVLDNGAVAALVIIGILLFLVALGTIYDVVIRCQKSFQEDMHDMGEVAEEEKTALLDGSVKVQTPREKGILAKIFLSFSAITNGGKILTVGNTKKDIGCLHGMRVLSMWWVILGHCYAFMIYDMDNILEGVSVLKRFSFQAIGNATFSVDTFFFLSGLLIAYLLLKELRLKDGKVNWAMLYFHRFWRLTPAYMLVLMFYTTLTKYIYVGPMGLVGNAQKNPCVDYWWTNLLYINNFYPTTGAAGCMAWGWYLANDMQFFIITPPIVYIIYKKRYAGLAVVCSLIMVCFITTGVLSKEYELSVFDIGIPANNPNTTTGFDQIYTKPYTRVSTYAVGILCGYILYLTDCRKMFRGLRYRLYALIAWCCAAAICLSVIYGCYGYVRDGEKMNVDLSAFYNSFSRFAWSVGLLIVVVACVHGHGGPVDTILSWDAWIPLSRLTYCAYLIHPVIIFLVAFGEKQPMHYDDITMVYKFIGHLVMSYGWAFLASLVFEAPMMGLEKAIFRR